jgi:hypothetical protein
VVIKEILFIGRYSFISLLSWRIEAMRCEESESRRASTRESGTCAPSRAARRCRREGSLVLLFRPQQNQESLCPAEALPRNRQLLRTDLAPGPQPQEVDAARQATHVGRLLVAALLRAADDRPHPPPQHGVKAKRVPRSVGHGVGSGILSV